MAEYTVSKLRLAQYVFDHMEEMRWHEGETGGFVGRLGEATIKISGTDILRTTLTISADGEQFTVFEPQPLEDAPISKWIGAFKTKILHQKLAPLDAEAQAAIHLKKVLNEIVTYACKQVIEKYKDPQYERKLRRRLWNKMTGDLDI